MNSAQFTPGVFKSFMSRLWCDEILTTCVYTVFNFLILTKTLPLMDHVHYGVLHCEEFWLSIYTYKYTLTYIQIYQLVEKRGSEQSDLNPF